MELHYTKMTQKKAGNTHAKYILYHLAIPLY